jgi:hypothetical protein
VNAPSGIHRGAGRPALGATGVVGCGGDDGNGGGSQNGGDGNGGRPLEVDQYEVAYDAARISCAEDGIQRLARELGADPTPAAVADASRRNSQPR